MRRADRRGQTGAAPGELLRDERGRNRVDPGASVVAGDRYEVRPSRAALASRSPGKSSRSSHSAAIGRNSFAANSCASSWSSRCSGVSVKEIPPAFAVPSLCRDSSGDCPPSALHAVSDTSVVSSRFAAAQTTGAPARGVRHQSRQVRGVAMCCRLVHRTAGSKREELDAAADVQADPGDVGGEVGAEEGDRVRDVLRLARRGAAPSA